MGSVLGSKKQGGREEGGSVDASFFETKLSGGLVGSTFGYIVVDTL